MRLRSMAILLLAGMLGGCSVSRQPAADFAPCDTVTGSSTSYGRALARRQAEQDFRQQFPDVRGDLINAGLRRVKVVRKRTTCRPYALFGGGTALTTCTAEARVCGR